jgi:phospholipase C
MALPRGVGLAGLVLLPSALGLVTFQGCSSPTPDVADAATDAGADALLRPPSFDRTETEAELAPKRAACNFQAGAWPAQTIGKDQPVYDDIPLKHVIVIMQENRSFDHYLGRLVARGYYQGGDFSPGGSGFGASDQVDVPPKDWALPDGNGNMVAPHPDDRWCYGVNHGWNDMHEDWNDGKNDRFVINNQPGGDKAMFYEDDSVIPFYYALADTFAIGDRYFGSVLTSTWPNRLYVMAATSFGNGDNSFVRQDTIDHAALQIFDLLDAAGHTWKDYTDGPHQLSFFPTFGFKRSTLDRYKNIKCDLMNDIQNDTLPEVSIVMGSEVGETSDEGPSALPGIGGVMVEKIIRALWASPAWKSTAVFITYDENGGLADHVPPPSACKPDDLPPIDEKNAPLPGAFDRLGFRVPFIVVSPFAKKHYVSHVVHDHSSIARFIEARFGLPAMTARDANAAPPLEMFDFQNPPFLTPPTISQTTTVDPTILTKCGQEHVKFGCP